MATCPRAAKLYFMFKFIAALVLMSSSAVASQREPGRCVIITEPGKQPRVSCSVPAGEHAKPCYVETSVNAEGQIVTSYVCTVGSR